MKRRTVVISGMVVLALLLVGAVFVGSQLLSGHGLSILSPSGLISALSGGGSSGPFHYNIKPAVELPPTPADVQGLFDHRQDNSVFVGTGKLNVSVKAGPGGSQQTASTHDGPTLEVIVTPQTLIYNDVTFRQYSTLPPSGQSIQQVLATGSLDDLDQATLVTVWGKQTGDRVIADVLVYMPPG